MKLKNGIEIVSLENRLARVRMRAPFGAANVGANKGLLKKINDPAIVSQWGMNSQNDNFNFENINDVMPQDGDYITVRFRALSKIVVPGHWIDWTSDNVLQDSTQMLLGATVYPNHDFWDINNWLGSVSNVQWDEAGINSQNVPGINAEYKIDALINPRIARGLLMTPPAIHSTSMTVLFEFDYSHPEMAAENKWKFIQNLGEEIDGQIVRFIVTRIVEYWEASLVFQGADRLAKQYDDDGESITDDDETDDDDFAGMQRAALKTPPNSNEEKTMKLTAKQRKSLGIEFDGEDVPETEILKAAESLAEKLAAVDTVNIAKLTTDAEAGIKFTEQQRAEVVRLAKLAELGADDGELDPVVAESIAEAGFDRLTQLKMYYAKRAAEKFPAGGRSSLEDETAVETAGGVKSPDRAVPSVGVL